MSSAGPFREVAELSLTREELVQLAVKATRQLYEECYKTSDKNVAARMLALAEERKVGR